MSFSQEENYELINVELIDVNLQQVSCNYERRNLI